MRLIFRLSWAFTRSSIFSPYPYTRSSFLLFPQDTSKAHRHPLPPFEKTRHECPILFSPFSFSLLQETPPPSLFPHHPTRSFLPRSRRNSLRQPTPPRLLRSSPTRSPSMRMIHRVHRLPSHPRSNPQIPRSPRLSSHLQSMFLPRNPTHRRPTRPVHLSSFPGRHPQHHFPLLLSKNDRRSPCGSHIPRSSPSSPSLHIRHPRPHGNLRQTPRIPHSKILGFRPSSHDHPLLPHLPSLTPQLIVHIPPSLPLSLNKPQPSRSIRIVLNPHQSSSNRAPRFPRPPLRLSCSPSNPSNPPLSTPSLVSNRDLPRMISPRGSFLHRTQHLRNPCFSHPSPSHPPDSMSLPRRHRFSVFQGPFHPLRGFSLLPPPVHTSLTTDGVEPSTS